MAVQLRTWSPESSTFELQHEFECVMLFGLDPDEERWAALLAELRMCRLLMSRMLQRRMGVATYAEAATLLS